MRKQLDATLTKALCLQCLPRPSNVVAFGSPTKSPTPKPSQNHKKNSLEGLGRLAIGSTSSLGVTKV